MHHFWYIFLPTRVQSSAWSLLWSIILCKLDVSVFTVCWLDWVRFLYPNVVTACLNTYQLGASFASANHGMTECNAILISTVSLTINTSLLPNSASTPLHQELSLEFAFPGNELFLNVVRPVIFKSGTTYSNISIPWIGAWDEISWHAGPGSWVLRSANPWDKIDLDYMSNDTATREKMAISTSKEDTKIALLEEERSYHQQVSSVLWIHVREDY